MVGGLSVMGSSMVDSHTSPCLCLEALPSSSFRRNPRKTSFRKQFSLSSSFVYSGNELRHLVKAKGTRRPRKNRRLVVVDEVAGQYEDGFEDVNTQILNYFTYKAARTVLNQLYEMNPTQYTWFYNFVVLNKPTDGKRFLRVLNKEKQDLAERVMITRLHLYGKWIKKCDHAEIYKEISEQNLELMRERLMETVIWLPDDMNTEKNC